MAKSKSPLSSQSTPESLSDNLDFVKGLNAVDAGDPIVPSEYEGYQPAPGSEKSYHILIEQETWVKGKKTSNPHVFRCNDKDIRQFFLEKDRLGYKVQAILHDPNPARTRAIWGELVESLKESNGRITAGLMRTGTQKVV